MRFQQLEFILAVEKTGSINLAAHQLFVSQSLVSASIKSLEDEIGQPIFMRSNKGITLTSFGKIFMPYARSVVVQINQMKELGKSNLPRIASLAICNNNFKFAVDLGAKLYNMHSDDKINLMIKDCSRQECIDSVSDHTAEIGIVRIWSFQANVMTKQLKSKNVVFYPCAVLPTVVIVGPEHPLYKHPKDSIPPNLLNPFPAIIYSYALYNPNFTIYDHIPNLRVNQYISVSTKSSALSMLHQTNAYQIVTAPSLSTHTIIDEYAGCRVFELEECKHFGQIGWMKHCNTNLSPLAQEYVDLLSGYLQT